MSKTKNITSKESPVSKKLTASSKATPLKSSVYVAQQRQPKEKKKMVVPEAKKKLYFQTPPRPSAEVKKSLTPKDNAKKASPIVTVKPNPKTAAESSKRASPLITETEPTPTIDAKKSDILKQHDTTAAPLKPETIIPSVVNHLPKHTEATAQPGPPKYKDLSKLLDSLRNSELLKEYSLPPPEPITRISKKPVSPKPTDSFILIVDDNDVQLFFMKKIVEELGYQCSTSISPATALQIISEKQPAIVFCDVNFGIGNPTGLDLFVSIRKKNIDIPFIIVSAFMQQEFIDKAMEIGVTEYLLKPVDREAFSVALKKYVTT